jgi:ABC-2 type transport system permease protein
MPQWIRGAAQANPVNWAIVGARSAMQGDAWATVGQHIVYLGIFVVVCGVFATQAFRVYQRTT